MIGKKICRICLKGFRLFPYLWDQMLSFFWKGSMKHCGKRVSLRPGKVVIKGLSNLSIGDDVVISRGATFYCTRAPLTIGNKVLMGPNPTIITGDHQIDRIGRYIADVKDGEKDPGMDLPVVIESDVWLGANVTILKGVTIGRGSVIAAGAVVNRNVPPYSISGGIPAHTLRFRFTRDQIMEHERLLYREDERLSPETVEKLFEA